MGEMLYEDEKTVTFDVEPPEALPLPFKDDPFLSELVYISREAESWCKRRRIVNNRFEGHEELISRLSVRRFPKWLQNVDIHKCCELAARYITPKEKDMAMKVYNLKDDAARGEAPGSEEEDLRLMQLVGEAVELSARTLDHHVTQIGIEIVGPNGWPDVYNAWFHSFIFGGPQNFLPQEVVIGCEVPWRLRPHEESIRESLEKGACPFSPASPAVAVPWTIVEYVKIIYDGLDQGPIHEAHLAGAFEVAFGLYQALGLDLPLFGILIDERNIDIYVASVVNAKKSRTKTEIHYFHLKRFNISIIHNAYAFCQMLNQMITYSWVLYRDLKEQLRHQSLLPEDSQVYNRSRNPFSI